MIVKQNSLPLLRRSKLLPGESLPSLLERLAKLNYYEHSRVIENICRIRTGNRYVDNAARPKSAQTFLQLARLTRVNEHQMSYAM